MPLKSAAILIFKFNKVSPERDVTPLARHAVLPWSYN